MKKILVVTLALAAALATAPAVMADTFGSNISGSASGSVSVSGALTGIAGETGDYNINTGTGAFTVGTYSFNGSIVANIASATSAGPGYGNNDSAAAWYSDVLNPTATALGYLPAVSDSGAGNPTSVSGLLFSLTGDAGSYTAGDQYVYLVLFFNGTSDVLYLTDASGNSSDAYSVSLSQPSDQSSVTPEPSSMLLMGTGLLLMAGFLFRQKALQGTL